MKNLAFLICCFCGLMTNAQSVTNTSGAALRNNNYFIEYSIGEVAITTLTGTSNLVTQGVLQPTAKVPDPACDMMTITHFENPAKNILRLAGIYDWVTSYQIFASDGRLVRSANFYNNHIDVSGLPAAGIYFIRLMPGCNGKYQVIKFMKR